MYLATEKGILEVPQKKPFKALFCRHRSIVIGDSCSKNGMRRISGRDSYAVCMDCGKILDEQHLDY